MQYLTLLQNVQDRTFSENDIEEDIPEYDTHGFPSQRIDKIANTNRVCEFLHLNIAINVQAKKARPKEAWIALALRKLMMFQGQV